MHPWPIFNHLLSRKFAFLQDYEKRLGGFNLTQNHSDVYEKAAEHG